MNDLREKARNYLFECMNQKPFNKWALDSTGTWMPLDMAEFGATTMLDMSCKWLTEKLLTYIEYCKNGTGESVEEFVTDFREAMEN